MHLKWIPPAAQSREKGGGDWGRGGSLMEPSRWRTRAVAVERCGPRAELHTSPRNGDPADVMSGDGGPRRAGGIHKGRQEWIQLTHLEKNVGSTAGRHRSNGGLLQMWGCAALSSLLRKLGVMVVLARVSS